MGLEDAPDLFVGIMKRCPERRLNLLGMMSIVINDGHTVQHALLLKAAVGSGELPECLRGNVHGNMVPLCHGDGRQGIQHVVLSGGSQGNAALLLPLYIEVIGGAAELIIGDIVRGIVEAVVMAVGHDLCGESLHDLLVFRNLAADDDSAVIRRIAGKEAEGMTDIRQILEEIQMVRLHVQDDRHRREKAQEAVGVLAGFHHKVLRPAHADIAADGIQHSAERNRRVTLRGHENLRDHGCGRGLSVSTGNGDGVAVMLHYLSQKLRSRQHRNAAHLCRRKFRIVRMNRCGIDDHADVIGDILRLLSVENLRSHPFQVSCQVRPVGIRTADRKLVIQKNLCQAAHADAADADKMHSLRFLKIYLIHICPSLCASCVP